MQSVPTSAEAAPEPAPEPTQDPPTGRPVAAGRTALALIAASTVVLAVVMGLGPSATVPPLDSGGPMWWLAARPSAATVIALERAGLLVGAIGVAMGLVAARRGWRPATGLLLGAGAAAAAVYIFLPPAGSIDVLNYAIYGRIASLGHNPYLMRPSELYRSGDAVGLFAPSNWRTLPTIYGPVATGVQWAAARLGGGSMARIVFWIRFANAVAFVAAAAGLVRLAGADRARQARVCLLGAVNPLMLFWLVGSGHVDVLPALLVVASLIAIRGLRVANGAVTGALIGAATAIKTPFILAAGGLFWAARRSPRTVIAGLAGVTAVLVPSYLLPGVLNTAVLSRRLSVSAGFIYPVPAVVAARPALFGGVVLGATAALALLLIWRLPAGQPGSAAVRPAIALALAWLAVFPVQTPWYDALVFPLLALMPWSRLDYLVVIRCLLLSEMLLPGVQANSGSLSVAIAEVSHLGLAALVGLLVVACLLRAWGGERSRYSSSASVSCSPDAAPPITGRDDNRMSAAQQAISNGAVTECN